MKEISKEEFELLMSKDMSEAFELFIQQRAFLEVLNVTDAIVSRLDTFEASLFYNASAYFAFDTDKSKYAFDLNADKIKSQYFTYENMSEAREHAFLLMQDISSDV